ncbi:MAG: putative bifunctional diguanylate cyclase/phosphodiesterase [Chloroflexota bacterium]|nr:EAL domain-containing protein [Chloroflexota bacterium]MBI5703781.1 EAL domain-containing protein [Chloroflexota bacterium]
MSKEKIFIAENNPFTAREIVSMLEQTGYVVAGQAERGEMVIQMVEELRPDLVLMEMQLRGQINGLESARKIHDDFDIPVLFISTQADTLTMQTAMLARAYGVLFTPFDARELKFHITMTLYKHRMERKLRESEERYALAVRAANDGIWDWNLETNEIYYSPRWKEILGHKDDEIAPNPIEWFQRIHPDDQAQVQAELVAHIKGVTSQFQQEYRIQHANGSYIWVLTRGLAVRNAKGAAYRMAGSQSDITARKLAEERLAHDAVHDALTGLPNRLLFLDRLQNRIERTKRNPNDLFAVMFLDLDRFKVVNDSLGHVVGDELLITTANRLKHSLRPEDTVSRLGGDEFAILLDSVRDVADARHVADRIKGKLMTTTLLGNVERSTTASVGIVISNPRYTSAGELLRDADAAMYRAKALGGNQHQVFDDTMHISAVDLIRLEGELKRAVERKEWLIHYQPVISLTTGKPVGVEALIRWQHPQKGVLLPTEFIQVAEDTALIMPIGEYILRAACRQTKIWRESRNPHLWVSVNISPRQFQDKGLVDKVAQILSETDLPGSSLRLEITESLAMRDVNHTMKLITELKTLGVEIVLDDFGTGYSSLSYLKQFPFRALKIDRSFIRDIQPGQNTQSLVTAILAMGRSLHLEIIAEGVETDEQLAFLRSLSCDSVQGFLLSHPLIPDDLNGLLG